MRLINTSTLEVREFVGHDYPQYAILSHTWGDEEATLQDWQDITQASLKAGFVKIKGVCLQALEDGFEYLWVDTNCIDKSSSAELSEAINSMFSWYQAATVCYVYLSDTPDPTDPLYQKGYLDKNGPFRQSKWFTRGWTLQELLAPSSVVFFSANWKRLGTKIDLKIPISQTTGIPIEYLIGTRPLWVASISKRMSWMSKRVTTRIEDVAYSMLGIFDIHMPLLYGEGSRAFVRLQEEILKGTDDHSLFCWEWNPAFVPDDWASILAPGPAVFHNSSKYLPTSWDEESQTTPYHITNSGLSIRLPLVCTVNSHLALAVLEVRPEWVTGDWDADLPYTHQLCIPLEKSRIYRRLPFPPRPFLIDMSMVVREHSIYVMARTRSPEVSRGYISAAADRARIFVSEHFDVGFLLTVTLNHTTVTLNDCTDNTVLNVKRSVLGFCFPGAESTMNETFGAGILKVLGEQEDTVLLAARTRDKSNDDATDGRRFNYYCHVFSGGRQISMQDIEKEAASISNDVEFSSNNSTTVGLGNEILYSAPGSDREQVVRIVHIVCGDRYRSDLIREHTDAGTSLLTSL